MTRTLIGATLVSLAWAVTAHATAYCEVLPTRDGFVALRDAPNANGKLLRRLKTGEDVQIDSTVRERAGWIKVIFTGEDRTQNQPGWVNRRLISRECG
jgi:hypothetical protein